MATVKPFVCIRPDVSAVSKVAALPYDVYSRREACEAVKGNPLSFLNIDRELLDARIEDGTFVTDKEACYYLYRLTMNGRSQTGIVACSSVDDYVNGVIKKHENTREDK